MNSSEMYLKISKNIFDCLNSANKEEYNKKELNDNLFLQLSFLTKFVSGKNIQENPNFNFFVSNKKSVIKNEVDKSIIKQENIIDDIDTEINLKENIEGKNNDEKITKEIENDINYDENKNENKNNKFDNFLTGEIDDAFDLKSRQSISIYNKDLNNNMLNQSQVNNFSQLIDKNNTFDLSYVGDCSTIFKDNQSFYNDMDESFFGQKDRNIRTSIGNKSNTNNDNTRFTMGTIKNLETFFDNEPRSQEFKKIKAKFDEINGDYQDSNITEEEFNYLIDKTNLEYVSRMFDKYTYLREDSFNNNSNSFNSKNLDSTDISLFSKKFSAMLLEIGCDKTTYDECLQQCIYKYKKFKFYDFISFFDTLLEKKYENNVNKYKFLLYISKNNNLDYIEDLSGFFELLRGKIIYDPQLYPVLKAKLNDRYRLFFPKDKVRYANKLSFLLETFFRNEE